MLQNQKDSIEQIKYFTCSGHFNPYGHKVSLRVTKVEFDFDVSVRLSDHLNCLPGRISDQVSPRNTIENVERLGHNPKIFKLFFYVFFPTWAEIIQSNTNTEKRELRHFRQKQLMSQNMNPNVQSFHNFDAHIRSKFVWSFYSQSCVHFY